MKKYDKRLSKKVFMFILIILFISVCVSIFYLLIETGTIKNEDTLDEKNFTIQDKCSIIAGKVIHPIDREDECMNKCIAQCEIYKLDYKSIEFELKQNSCNICKCFCN